MLNTRKILSRHSQTTANQGDEGEEEIENLHSGEEGGAEKEAEGPPDVADQIKVPEIPILHDYSLEQAVVENLAENSF